MGETVSAFTPALMVSPMIDLHKKKIKRLSSLKQSCERPPLTENDEKKVVIELDF